MCQRVALTRHTTSHSFTRQAQYRRVPRGSSSEGHSASFAPPPGSLITEQARKLVEEGYVSLGSVLSSADVADVRSYFAKNDCYNAHVVSSSDRVPRRIGSGAEAFHYGSYTLTDIVKAPLLLELANRPEIIAVAEAYLGCTPTLYSLNAWWSFSGHGTEQYAQQYHRDTDDFKMCTLFVYLTDVGFSNGPHSYVRRSHRVELAESILGQAQARLSKAGMTANTDSLYPPGPNHFQDAIYETVFEGLIDSISGPAGFAILADTGGLHKGIPIVEGARLMFWARYGLYRNQIVALSGVEPVQRDHVEGRLSSDHRTAYINRCIVGIETEVGASLDK